MHLSHASTVSSPVHVYMMDVQDFSGIWAVWCLMILSCTVVSVVDTPERLCRLKLALDFGPGLVPCSHLTYVID
jgi:hypothetical protein